MGEIIHSETSQNGKRVVTIGKWSAVPTGPWCAWNPREAHRGAAGFASDGMVGHWRTVPRGGETQMVWWTIHVDNERLFLHGRKWQQRRGKGWLNTPFASPEDRWSSAYANASGINRPKEKPSNYNGHFSVGEGDQDYITHDLWRALVVRPIDEIDEIATIAKDLGAGPLALATIARARKTAVERAETRGEKAKTTRTHTEANSERGGNPKVLRDGDRVVLTETQYFGEDRVPVRSFWYVHGAHGQDIRPSFYRTVNAEGLGTGPRYRAKKKDARRVCRALFEELTDFTTHERFALLAEQAQGQARKAKAAAQATADA